MTETDLLQEIEADLQRQKLEAFWKQWGNTILTTALLIVLGTAGYEWWSSHNKKMEQDATSSFVQIAQPIAGRGPKTDPLKQVEDLEKFAATTNQAGPAVLARIKAAAAATEAGNRDEALKIYEAMAKDMKVEKLFREFADIMAISFLVDRIDTQEDLMNLLARLQPLTLNESAWRYSAREYVAHLTLKLGKKEEALRLFYALAQDPETTASILSRAHDMVIYLNNVLDAEGRPREPQAADQAQAAPQDSTPASTPKETKAVVSEKESKESAETKVEAKVEKKTEAKAEAKTETKAAPKNVAPASKAAKPSTEETDDEE